MSERRGPIREHPPHRLGLQVSLAALDRPPVSAGFSNLTSRGAEIELREDADTTFTVGDIVDVHLRAPSLASAVLVPSWVRHVIEDEKVTIGVEFIDWLGLHSQVPDPLLGVFSQRADYRVKVEAKKAVPVIVTVVGGGNQIGFNGYVKDVSTSGAGFFVHLRADREEAVQLKVAFRLPGSEERMAFVCRSWHWHNTNLGLYCGVIFDFDRTENIRKYGEILQAYVDRRLLTAAPR